MVYSPLAALVVTLAAVAHALPQRDPYTPGSNDPSSPDYPRDENPCGTPAERAAGFVWCDFECVNRNITSHHCGSCYNWCDELEGAFRVCREGACVKCPPDQRMCANLCVNNENDNNHCGDCYNKCEVGKNCVKGSCV